jgi:hypothetical protein
LDPIDFAFNYMKKWKFHISHARQAEVKNAWDQHIMSESESENVKEEEEEIRANIEPPITGEPYKGFTTGF